MLLIYLGKIPRTNTCKKLGDSTVQTILLISLFVIEVVAFGWLIIEAKASRKQRETILEVEKQILNLEKTIISMERAIIKKVNKISNLTKREKLLLENEKLIKNEKKHN